MENVGSLCRLFIASRTISVTIPIVASMKKMLKESKKAKRSIALSKRLHLEVIRVNWQCKIDQSSR